MHNRSTLFITLFMILVVLPSCQATQELMPQDLATKDYKNNCDFCKAGAGDLAALHPGSTVIYEDDYVFAFKKPSKKEALIVPKKHRENISSLDTNNADDQRIIIHIIKAAQQLSKMLSGSQAYQLHINNGAQAGQTTFHLHVHFIPAEPWKK